jgi:hypothetical protein
MAGATATPTPTMPPTATSGPAAGGQVVLLDAPQRAVDTRPGSGLQGAGQPLAGYFAPACYQITGWAGVPEDAVGVLANVTAISPPAPGHLTVWPAGQPLPSASNLNYAPEQGALANMATVRLGTGGQVCVVGAPDLHVAIDVAAYIR